MPAVKTALPSIAAGAQAIAACRRFPSPPSGGERGGDESQDRCIRLGDRDRPEESVSVTGKPGGKVESVRGTAAAAVTERDAPEIGRLNSKPDLR